MRRRGARELGLILVWAGAGATVYVGGPPWWLDLSGWEIGRLCLGAVMLGAIPWRERRPVAFALAAVAVAPIGLMASQVPLVGVYTVAKVCRRWVAVTVTVVAAGVGAVATLNFVERVEPGPFVVMSVTLHLTAASFGLFIGARDKLVESLREQARLAEIDQAARAEEIRLAERRRIAGEMHDVLGHRLSLLSVHAGALELRTELPCETVRRTAAVLRTTTHEALSDLRQIVSVLREPVAELWEVTPATVDLDELDDLAGQARAVGTPTELVVAAHLRAGPPPEPLRRTAYRVVQEGLTNARRHRPGSAVRIELGGASRGELTVEITTAAARRQSSDQDTGSGTGLIGLSERVAALTGGTLEHRIDDDGIHRLRVHMPWPRRAPE